MCVCVRATQHKTNACVEVQNNRQIRDGMLFTYCEDLWNESVRAPVQTSFSRFLYIRAFRMPPAVRIGFDGDVTNIANNVSFNLVAYTKRMSCEWSHNLEPRERNGRRVGHAHSDTLHFLQLAQFYFL